MKTIRLIALDMDGTVLTDEKQIDEQTSRAIHDALAEGIEVIFCTGRSYMEMKDILADFPDMHYLCGESGGLIFDTVSEKVLYKTAFPPETVRVLQENAKLEDLMTCMFSDGECVVDAADINRMAHFQMAHFQELYSRISTVYEDALEHLIKTGRTIEKLNYYHASREGREASCRRLKAAGIDAEMVYSEYSSLEITPGGMSKAAGLLELGRILGIPLEEMAMVGDADNDLSAIRAAGLGIAMGNACEAVKAAASLVVADNNHGGCAEAVRYCLAGK